MRASGLVFLILIAAAVAAAQTKISGTVKCSKPDQQQSMDVGDRPNHTLTIVQGKCTWTQPLEIAGTKSTNDNFTISSEIAGNKMYDHGYVTDTTDSGDKWTVRVVGAEVLKDGKPVSEQGTWSFVSGTGKVKGIKGKGTYTGKADGDDMVVAVEGAYEIPK